MKRRTRLTDDEALTYVRRTVVLNSDDARRDGVVDAVEPFTMPKGARGWVIVVKSPQAGAPSRPAAAAASPL